MNANSAAAHDACQCPAKGTSQAVEDRENARNLAELLNGLDLKAVTEIADAIRSKPGLLEKMVGG